MHIVPFDKPDNPYVASLIKGKIFSALKRAPKLLTIKGYDSNRGIITFDVDDKKIGYAIDSIARTLYFHEFKTCFEGKCHVFPGHYTENSVLFAVNTQVLNSAFTERQQWNTARKGEYPEIFQYQFSNFDQLGSAFLILTFYETINIVVVLADKEHEADRAKLDPFELAQTCNIDPIPFFIAPQGYSTKNDSEA